MSSRKRVPLVDWTADRVKDLRALWDTGLSPKEIALQLGGTTKSAVTGKLGRLGIPKRTSIERQISNARVARRSVPDKPLPVLVPAEDGVRFHALSAHCCKYALDDPGPGNMDHTLMCGQPTEELEPWCPAHKAIVFNKPDSVNAQNRRQQAALYAARR